MEARPRIAVRLLSTQFFTTCTLITQPHLIFQLHLQIILDPSLLLPLFLPRVFQIVLRTSTFQLLVTTLEPSWDLPLGLYNSQAVPLNPIFQQQAVLLGLLKILMHQLLF